MESRRCTRGLLANWRAGRHIQEAYEWYGLGEWKKAAEEFKKALEYKPKSGALYARIADCYIGLGQPEVAYKYFHEAVRAAPNEPQPHFVLAGHWYQGGDIEAAVTELTVALQANPRYQPARLMLAQIYHESGFPDKAEGQLSLVSQQIGATYREICHRESSDIVAAFFASLIAAALDDEQARWQAGIARRVTITNEFLKVFIGTTVLTPTVWLISWLLGWGWSLRDIALAIFGLLFAWWLVAALAGVRA